MKQILKAKKESCDSKSLCIINLTAIAVLAKAGIPAPSQAQIEEAEEDIRTIIKEEDIKDLIKRYEAGPANQDVLYEKHTCNA